ncbi:MAG TPA: SigE family RNA polymerase sigma factor [Streptosporangiaceae bacterium]|nr:SigE family RNA polymerase sigma factor [Streptosporangiaceae bacterium]
MNVGGDHGGQHGREGEGTAGQERIGRGRNAPAGLKHLEAPVPAARARPLTAPNLTPPRPRTASREGAEASIDAEFQEFVVSRGRSLLHSAYLLTGHLADAEDLVQSTLAKTYQAWNRIEDRKALDGYVRRAMVNTHISWWRRRKVDEYPTDEIPDQPVADTSASSEMHDSLRRAIDRLPHRMRAAVVLRFFEDMTEAEVADVLGVSLGTVKSTVSRAVAKLRSDAELFSD